MNSVGSAVFAYPNRHTLRWLAVTLISSASWGTAGGAVLHVPSEYVTLQSGITAALPGDTVLVAAGVYRGAGNRDLDFSGKGIVLRSEEGPAVTVIDVEGSPEAVHRGFRFHSGEGPSAVVDGFTIRGGYRATDSGGGIICESASPVIRNCIVTANTVARFGEDGGGIVLRASAARIEDCVIEGNRASYGGGIACRLQSSPVILRCRVVENDADFGGGIDCGGTSTVEISDCVIAGNTAEVSLDQGAAGGLLLGGSNVVRGTAITGNRSPRGGGVFCTGGSSRLIACTVAGNEGGSLGGGGIACMTAVLELERVIVSGNCAPTGPSILADSDGTIRFGCSLLDLAGVARNGGELVDLGENVLADPLFCEPADCAASPTVAGDYRISSDSPAVPGNGPCDDWIGAFPIGCPTSSMGGLQAVTLTGAPGILVRSPHPNPATDFLRFELELPRATSARVTVVDAAGRRIATAAEGSFAAGLHVITWRIPRGKRLLPPGTYFLYAEGAGSRAARPFIVLR